MKRSMQKLRKAFTIVELVIVIAVIAILAAVLVPTFIYVVEKANVSADIQAVTQMNKILQIDSATEEKPKDIFEVKEILSENGYNSDFTTYYDGYLLGWYPEENTVVLVEKESTTVVFPENCKDVSVNVIQFFEVSVVSSKDEFLSVIEGIGQDEYHSVVLSSNIDLNAGILQIAKGNLELDLNGHTLSYSGTADTEKSKNYAFAVQDGVSLYLRNGTVEIKKRTAFAVTGNAKFVAENVTINAPIIREYAVTTNGSQSLESEIVLRNCTVNGRGAYPIYAPAGNWTLENTTVIGRSVVSGGTFTCKNCTFESTGSTEAAKYLEKTSQEGKTVTFIKDNTSGAITFGDPLLIILDRGNYQAVSASVSDTVFCYASGVSEENKAFGLRIVDMKPDSGVSVSSVRLENNEYGSKSGEDGLKIIKA